ncbi:MAG: tetratricopeptide repeat protein [Promethearchaeota archaeon]
MSQKKKIIDQLKKDFKQAHGGLGGLEYSSSPMKYNKMFEKQADMILKSQQPQIKPTLPSTPSYKPIPKPNYTTYRQSIPSYTPSYTRRGPTEEEKLYSKGLKFLEESKYGVAIKQFQEAIKIKPYYSNAWKCMGNAYEKLENYRKAIESYEKAVEISSSYTEAWKDMGALFQKLGGYRNAVYCYKKVKKLVPHNKDVRRILKRLKNLKKKSNLN